MTSIILDNLKFYCKVKFNDGVKTTRVYMGIKDIRLNIDYEKYYLVNSINMLDGLITITVDCNIVLFKGNYVEERTDIILSFNQVDLFYQIEENNFDNLIKLNFQDSMWKQVKRVNSLNTREV